MKIITLKNGNIIVQLGGMQITRKQLDAVKLTNPTCKTDQDAADRLILAAERAFTDVLHTCEFQAEVELEDELNEYGDRGGREYVSPDEHLSTAYCDAIRK